MVKTASLFSQLLDQFPRHEFAKLVKKHNAEYKAKGFTCWTQFVSMLFCQVARTDSLREICNGLACLASWPTWAFPRRPTSLHCPTPTSTDPRNSLRTCSGPR